MPASIGSTGRVKFGSTVLLKGISVSTGQKGRKSRLLFTVSFASRCFSSNSRTSFFFSSVEENVVCQISHREMTTELNPLQTRKPSQMADCRDTRSKFTSNRNSLFLQQHSRRWGGERAETTLPNAGHYLWSTNIFLTYYPPISADRMVC